jgi:hypothetical protein
LEQREEGKQMFKSIDTRYGAGLTKAEIEMFNIFINSLDDEDNINLCEKCHEKHGCGNSHDTYVADTGICSICGKNDEVVCCAIANKVLELDIPVHSYHKNGQRVIPIRR